MNIVPFPQFPSQALDCPHGNRVWWGHECGECEAVGFYAFIGEYLLDIDDDVCEVVEHLDGSKAGYNMKVQIVEDTCGRCNVGECYELDTSDLHVYDGRPVQGKVPIGAPTQYEMSTPVPTFDSVEAAEEWLNNHAH